MNNESILCFDPGNHTGWAFLDHDNLFSCGTIQPDESPKHLKQVAGTIQILNPDLVVYETFNLYPSMAKSLAWNSFFPCEVIGVIKCVATTMGCKIVGQAPSIKKYAGNLPKCYFDYLERYKVEKTEHNKDATQHLCYYLRKTKELSRL